jgi:LDH2 family malate/lactate/ureidoglycolate dehydrogenase
LNDKAEPTTDPKVAQQARRLLPLGGSRESGSHKGYGLGILVEILCGVLTGTLTALNPNQEPRGHFFGAIDPAAFRPAAEFKADMDRLIRELKSTPPVEGESRVYVAGEIEFETAEERSERGIPLHSSVLRLRDVARAGKCRMIWNDWFGVIWFGATGLAFLNTPAATILSRSSIN